MQLRRQLQFAKAKISSNGWRAFLATLPGSTAEERLCYNRSDNVWLTFDDFAEPPVVHGILAILTRTNVKAMFFLSGEWAARHPKLVDEIRGAGHIVGTHGMAHKNLRHLDKTGLEAELTDGLGSTYIRPPYGEINGLARRIIAAKNLKIVGWSIDSQDWRGISPDQIKRNVLGKLHPGAVILMHLHPENTSKVLRDLIEGIESRGYTLPRLKAER